MMAVVMSADRIRMNAVICTYGWRGLLERTLRNVAEARRPEGFERLWIIENGSDAGARKLCADLGNMLPLEYVHLPDQGKSRALQFALDKLGTGLVVFLDDDIRINSELFEAYARAALTHGASAFFGGPVFPDYEQEPPAWLVPDLPPSAKGWQATDPAAPITRSCFLGANYGAFVERLQAVGGFKAHLGVGSEGNPVGEEFEIQDRLLAAGCLAVYLPDVQVWHWVPRERCSPRWTHQRHYRIWLTNGLTETKDHAGSRWRGAPRWMWRRLAQLGLRALAANAIRDPQRRFKVKDQYWQWRGYLDGVRLRHRRETSGHNAQGHAAERGAT